MMRFKESSEAPLMLVPSMLGPTEVRLALWPASV